MEVVVSARRYPLINKVTVTLSLPSLLHLCLTFLTMQATGLMTEPLKVINQDMRRVQPGVYLEGGVNFALKNF
jgi:hypothetical protein